jgi:hypothetical protein
MRNSRWRSRKRLGAIGTTYGAPFHARGLEPSDSFLVAGNSLTVSMNVSQPGDWIRVVTASQVPEPGTLALFGAALALIGLGRRRNAGSPA